MLQVTCLPTFSTSSMTLRSNPQLCQSPSDVHTRDWKKTACTCWVSYRLKWIFSVIQGSYCTGKRKRSPPPPPPPPQTPCQEKIQGIWNFAKTRGILYTSCKFPDSKDDGYCDMFYETVCIFQVSFSYKTVTIPEIDSEKMIGPIEKTK